jgi:Mg/Co/Ni transporter MgtE
VRESLIASMDSRELVAAPKRCEADEIADLADDLPEQVMQDVIRALPQGSASSCARQCRTKKGRSAR